MIRSSEKRTRTDLVRRLVRSARHGPDRLLHALRRRRALDRLAALPAPANVLVLCLGNINRSVYTAEVLRRALAGSDAPPIRIHSAGFIGPGRPASELARSTAHARGFDLASHVSRVAEIHDLRAADLVVVMTPEQGRRACGVAGKRLPVLILGDLDPEPISTRAIQDPYGQSEEVFEQVFDRIDRCVAILSAALPLDPRRKLP